MPMSLLPVVAPTYMGEECDQKPQVSYSKVAWQLLVHNMPEDIADNLDHHYQFSNGHLCL